MYPSLAVLLLVVGNGTIPAADVDKPRLRQLADLPKVSMELGVSFSISHGLRFNEQSPDPATASALLRKLLTESSGETDQLLRLGDLLARQGLLAEADKAFSRAVILYRQRLREHPKDGYALALLGDALTRTSEREKGQALLEQGTKQTPRDWRVWLLLAQNLDSRSFQAVLKKPFRSRVRLESVKDLALLEQKPTQDQVDQMRRLRKEANRCFDRAIALGPREPQSRLARLGSRIFHDLVDEGIHTDGKSMKSLAELFVPTENAAELRTIARLCPQDSGTIAATLWIDLLTCAHHKRFVPITLADEVKNRTENEAQALALRLPAENQAFFRWGLRQLEELTQSAKPEVAAPACEAWASLLAMIHFTFRVGPVPFPPGPLQEDPVLLNLRRVIGMDPSRDRSWDMLMMALGKKKKIREAAKLAQERLAFKDDAHTRFLLARTHVDLGKIDRAREELEAGLRKDPRDLRCRLGIIACAIKRADRTTDRLLDEIEPAVKHQADEECRICYLLLRGIQAALADQTVKAGELFRKVLRQDVGNTMAGRALAALGERLTATDRPLARAYLDAKRVELKAEDERPGAAITSASIRGDDVTDEALFFLTLFPRLRSLHLSGEGITDVGLVYLKNLPELRSLEIQNAPITDQGLIHLKGFPALRSLGLYLEKITDDGLTHLQALENLEELKVEQDYIRWNREKRITDAGIAHLKKLVHLRRLELNLEITDKGVAHAASIPRLRILRLNSNEVTDRGLIPLKRLKDLEELEIGSDKVTDAGLTCLQDLRRLRDLSLAQAKITDAGLVHLKGLTNLRWLDLQGARITDVGLAQLRDLTQLRYLDVGTGDDLVLPPLPGAKPKSLPKRPRITHAGLEYLKGMTKLESLSLQGHAIDEGALLQLSGLRHLQSLNLIDTEVSSKAIAQLRKKLPQLRVSR